MEHLNRIVKNEIRGLGANKCVYTVSDVMENYDDEHGVNAISGHHTKASKNKDLDIVTQELLTRNNPFVIVSGRKYQHVSIPKSSLLVSLILHCGCR